jgi:hypothetical protein
MPTKNVKHRMLVEAKRIANTEYKTITQSGEDNIVIFISSEEQRKRAAQLILNNHPEFDPNTFRQMIKEIEIRNKQKEE